MSVLDDWVGFLFDRKNRMHARVLGCILTGLPLAFIIGGGFGETADGGGIIFSSGWFREIFILAISLSLFVGVLLLVAGFLPRRSENDEEE